jgi:LysR family hydrogen peroxide-inducible transcriptional activator
MDITQLRYLLTIAELGSFSKAAAYCHVSQPALSVQIQKLEVGMGSILLHRNHRQIVPTPQGLALIKWATQILADVESARREVQGLNGIRADKVSLGVLPTIAPYFLAPALSSFTEKCPKTQVIIYENILAHSLQLIEADKLDFGIVSLPVRETGFQTETLFSEELLLALYPTHRLCQKRAILAEDLRSEEFILLEEDHCLGNKVIDLCERHDFHPRIVFRCGQLATIQSLVAAGKGISLIPRMAVGKEPAGIIYRQLEAPGPKRSIAIVTRNKRPLKCAVMEFLKHLRQTVKHFCRLF